MAESNIDSKMMNLNLNKKTDINILLLGSTGVGKSTLINSFANYLTYGELKQAKKDKLMVLIPSQLTVIDKHGEYHLISTGDTDSNEYLQTGESATQDVKTYVFPIWNGQIKIRLIDTPGMGDTRGIRQDDINSENILSYISNLHELHAICFLLKPNESRNTVFFNYCINQIFSRLDKSASDNIIFCFTNTRGTDYNPGETVGVLKRTVEEIANRPPFAKIPFDKNIFCFDNEPFRYLAAIKNNIEFSSDIKDRNKESWEKSSIQCWNLINYIVGDKDSKPLKPHFVKSTNAINEARRMINQLSKPLAEIMQLIHHNMAVLERHKELLEQDNASLEEMKTKLYIPVVALEVTQMDKPATVCTTKKCSDIIQIAGKNSWNYKQRCHDPCYLTNVGKEVLGDPALVHCAAMQNTNTCSQCYCDYRVHMHVYYTTKTVEKKEKDENMQKKITNRFEVMENKQRLIKSMQNKQAELSGEHKTIVEICAKFAHFLQNNAITPFSDSYKEYIEYLIDREKSLGKVCDKETIKHLQDLLAQYVEIKNRFDEALRLTKTVGRDELVTSKEINESVQILYKLKHNGDKIRELYNCQKKARSKEFQDTEYCHTVSHRRSEKKDNDKKEKKSKTHKGKKDKRTGTKDEKKDKEDRKVEKKDKEDRSEKRDKKGDGTVEKKDKKEKKGDADDEKKGDSRKQQNKGRARHVSPPPSYQETQRNQRPNRFPPNRGHSNQFNQFPSSSQMGQIPPLFDCNTNQNFPGNGSDRTRADYKFNISLQIPPNRFPQNQPFSPNINQPFPPNMNQPFPPNMGQPFPSNRTWANPSNRQPNMNPPFSPNMNQPFNSDHRHGVNLHSNTGNWFRNNEQGRYRDNRGRGRGINKKNHGKKGKPGVNNVKEKEKGKIVSEDESSSDSSSSNSDSSDSSSSD